MANLVYFQPITAYDWEALLFAAIDSGNFTSIGNNQTQVVLSYGTTQIVLRGSNIDIAGPRSITDGTITEIELIENGTTLYIASDFITPRTGPEIQGVLDAFDEPGHPDAVPYLFALLAPEPVVVTGTSGRDRLYGGNDPDVINAGAGADWVFAGGGDDVVNGGDGDDYFAGSTGHDTIDGGNDYDTIGALPALFGPGSAPVTFVVNGANGAGTMSGTYNATSYQTDFVNIERAEGGGGNDTITVTTGFSGTAESEQGGQSFSFVGGQGNDTLIDQTSVKYGSLQANYDAEKFQRDYGDHWGDEAGENGVIVNARSTSISVLIGLDDVIVAGGTAFDTYGDVDTIATIRSFRLTDANDLFVGGTVAMYVEGRAGNDSIHGSTQDDILIGGRDNDPQGHRDDDEIFGYAGNDYIRGGDGDDYIDPGTGNDEVHGGAGDDFIVAWSGHDVYYGGEGRDTVSFQGWSSGVTIDLALTTAQTVSGGSLTLHSIEQLVGGNGNDTFRGNDERNHFYGGRGNDSLFGRGGDDFFRMSEGNDSVDGGADYDVIGTDWQFQQAGAPDATILVNGANGSGSISFSVVTGTHTTTFTNVERVEAGGGNDTITVTTGFSGTAESEEGGQAFSFVGGRGNDTLIDQTSVKYGSLQANYDAEKFQRDYGDHWGDEAGENGVIVNLSGIAIDADAGFGTRNVAAGTARDTFDDVDIVASVRSFRLTDANDVIHGGAASLFVDARGGDDIIHGGSGDDDLRGGAGDDYIHGGDGDDQLNGGSGNDEIHGGNGDDYIDASSGFDLVDGGAGYDVIGPRDDFYDYGAPDATILVDGANGSGTISGIYEAAPFQTTFTNIERIQAGGGNDTITVTTGFSGTADGEFDGQHFSFSGGRGNDQAIDQTSIKYGSLQINFDAEKWERDFGDHWGDEAGENGVIVNLSGTSLTADVGFGQRSVAAGTARDTYDDIDSFTSVRAFRLTDTGDVFRGGASSVFVDAGRGNDVITGSSQDDILIGSWGSGGSGSDKDIIYGLAGNDQIYGGDDDDILDGGLGDDYIEGGNGNDTFVAWSGFDVYDGGDGTDTVTFAGWASAVTINLGLTTAQAVAGGSVTLSSIENMVGGNGDDTLRGSSGANVLWGGNGNDTFQAWAGHDTFHGEAGSDTVTFAGWTSAVTINLTLVAAQAVSGGSVTLSGIENVTGGNGNDTLTGDAGDNVLHGGVGGNDTLNGGDGNDTFIVWSGADIFNGGNGTDTVSFAGWGSGVSIRLDLATAQAVPGGSVTLSSIENIVGGNGNDTLRGSSGANILWGGNGNDTFQAWAGHDTFHGEAGSDTLTFAGWGSAVTINLGLTTAQAVAGGSVTLSGIENVTGGNGNDTLTGDAGDNVLHGGAGGNDTLNGGDGNDTFMAWSGADTFHGGNGTDAVSFAGWGSGVNIRLDLATAQAVSGGSVTLSSIENIVGGNGNDTLRGSSEANVLWGGNGNDTFQAWAGHDTFHGEAGSDTVTFAGWTSAVTINLGLTTAQAVAGGSVTLSGIENVTGGNGNDTLTGDAGANVLAGGLGRDVLTGGADADTFRFVSVADSSLTAGQHDVITDFSSAEGDRIDLSALDAVVGVPGSSFTFLDNDGQTFTGAGQLRYRTEGGNTFVEASLDGGTSPDFVIQLTGIKVLTAADFIL